MDSGSQASVCLYERPVGVPGSNLVRQKIWKRYSNGMTVLTRRRTAGPHPYIVEGKHQRHGQVSSNGNSRALPQHCQRKASAPWPGIIKWEQQGHVQDLFREY